MGLIKDGENLGYAQQLWQNSDPYAKYLDPPAATKGSEWRAGRGSGTPNICNPRPTSSASSDAAPDVGYGEASRAHFRPGCDRRLPLRDTMWRSAARAMRSGTSATITGQCLRTQQLRAEDQACLGTSVTSVEGAGLALGSCGHRRRRAGPQGERAAGATVGRESLLLCVSANAAGRIGGAALQARSTLELSAAFKARAQRRAQADAPGDAQGGRLEGGCSRRRDRAARSAQAPNPRIVGAAAKDIPTSAGREGCPL